MLVLARFEQQRIYIGDDIVVTIVNVRKRDGQVRVGVEAPKAIRVDREEVRERLGRTPDGDGRGGSR